MITDGNSIFEISREVSRRQARNMRDTTEVKERQAAASDDDLQVGEFTKALIDLNGSLFKLDEKSEEQMVGGVIRTPLKNAVDFKPPATGKSDEGEEKLDEIISGQVLGQALEQYVADPTGLSNRKELNEFMMKTLLRFQKRAEVLTVRKNKFKKQLEELGEEVASTAAEEEDDRSLFSRMRDRALGASEPGETPQDKKKVRAEQEMEIINIMLRKIGRASKKIQVEFNEAINDLPEEASEKGARGISEFIKYSLTDDLVRAASQVAALITSSKKIKLKNISEDTFKDYEKALDEFMSLNAGVQKISAPQIKTKLGELKKSLRKLRGLLINILKSYAGPKGTMEGGGCGCEKCEGGAIFHHPVGGMRRFQ